MRRHLAEVRWPLGVDALGDRQVVGEELGRHDRREGREPFGHAVGQHQRRPPQPPGRVVVRGDQQVRPVRPQPLQQVDDAREGGPAAGHREHVRAVAHERDGTVLEIGRRVGIGEHAGDLLELERPLPRGGVLEAAPDDDAAVHRGVLAGDSRHVRAPWPAPARWPPARRPAPRSRPDPAGAVEGQRQEGHRGQLRDVRLGRRDTTLSGPAARSTASSAAAASGESGSLVMATVRAPWRRASSTTPTTSGERPDCEMPTTRARATSGARP